MKRRGFLQMIGAASLAPLLPSAASGQSASYGAALAHAKARVSVSAWGISQSLNIALPQADALMRELAKNGVICTIKGGQGRWAMSRIYVPVLPQRLRRAAARAQEKPQLRTEPRAQVVSAEPLAAHLHRLCESIGLTLNPRCAAQSFNT